MIMKLTSKHKRLNQQKEAWRKNN